MTYSRYRISYKKQLYCIICIIAVAGLFLYSLLGPRGYLDLRQARREMEARQERVKYLEQDNRDHLKRIEALSSDKKALEGFAREKGYGREGEIVQEFYSEPEEETK